jgi:PTS system mannose-specific IID component
VRLSKGVTAEILKRSFFIQGAWNFKGMQNIGFVNAMLPGLKKIHPDSLDRAASRYLRFFNTHPYMAPTVMGIFLNLEENGQDEMIEKFQPSIAGSLAAIGDFFFWATLKPVIALLFLLSILVDQIWGIALVLIAYNSIHIWTMTWGFMNGYKNGPAATLDIGRILSVDRAKYISYFTPFLSGVVLVLLAQLDGIGQGFVTSILLFSACIIAIKLRLGVLLIFYGVFTLTLIWTIIR